MNYVYTIVPPEHTLSVGPFQFNPRTVSLTLVSGAYSLLKCYLRDQVIWSFVLINFDSVQSYVEFTNVGFEEGDTLSFTNLGDGFVSVWVGS